MFTCPEDDIHSIYLDNELPPNFVAEYEAQTGKTLETNRYYFLMPNGINGEKGDDDYSDTYGKFATSWYNEYSDAPAI